jgi:hypothetical protein
LARRPSPGRSSSERAARFTPGRRVRDEGELVGRGVEVARELAAGARDEFGEPAVEEVDRFPLEVALVRLVALEHRSRARAERAVVEERDLGVEKKVAAELFWGRCSHAIPFSLHLEPPPTQAERWERAARTVTRASQLRAN